MAIPPRALPLRLRFARGISILLVLPCLFMLLAVPLRPLSSAEWLAFGSVAAMLVGAIVVAVALTRRSPIGWYVGVVLGALAALAFLIRFGDFVQLWRAGMESPIALASSLLATGVHLGFVLVGVLCLSARTWRETLSGRSVA